MRADRQSGRLLTFNFVLYNILLPAVLITVLVHQVSVCSSLYLLFLLAHPVAVGAPLRITEHPQKYLLLLFFTSLVLSLADVVYNVLSYVNDTFAHYTTKCRKHERLFAQLGFTHWDFRLSSTFFLQLFTRHLVLLFSTILLLRIFVLKLLHDRKERQNLEYIPEVKVEPVSSKSGSQLKSPMFIKTANNILFSITLTVTAFIFPSLSTLPFILISSYIFLRWTFNRSLIQKEWRSLRLLSMFYTFSLLCVHYAFQIPFSQRFIRPESFVARIFGLNRLARLLCDRYVFPKVTQSWYWPERAQPFCLLFLYYLAAYQIKAKIDEIADPTPSKNQKQKPPHPKFKLAKVKITISKPKLATVTYTPPDSEDEEKQEKERRKESRKRTLSIHRASEILWKDAFFEKFHRNIVTKVAEFAQSHSYVLTLFVMMAWSLTYHSWLTFVLLITSCVVWMYPNSQQFCMKICPLIAVYATVLLLIQYIYSLNLTQDELPDENPWFLRQFGLEKPRDSAPLRDLLLKTFFTAVIYSTLRQRIISNGKCLASGAHEEKEKMLEDNGRKKNKSGFLNKCREKIADYWVLFNLCLLLAISLQDPVVFYRLLYMTFFLIFINVFQLSFPTWRKMLYSFWLVMLVYCMLVLSLIYTFQFHGVPELYHQYLSEDVVRSMGLQRISSSRLFIRLLTPISFLIFTLIQVNFFHERLMKRTGKWEEILFTKNSELSRIFAELHRQSEMQMDFFRQQFTGFQNLIRPKEEKVEEHEEKTEKNMKVKMKVYLDRIERKCHTLVKKRSALADFAWRLLELHIDRIVTALMIHIAVNEVSATNVPLVIFVSVVLPREHLFNPLSSLMSVWTAILIISKMVYQLDAFKADQFQTECDTAYLNGTYNSFSWVGMEKTDNVSLILRSYILLCILFASRNIVLLRQTLMRREKKEAPPLRGILFPDVNRKKADHSLTKCIQYFANYFFYKFGLEICMIISVATIGIRCDLLAVIYGIFLIGALVLERQQIAKIWPYYTTFLAVILSVQYLLCLGIPKIFCKAYPWSSWDSNMIEWLFLPDHTVPPNPVKIWADFVQLVAVSAQSYVFAIENSKEAAIYPGGVNSSVVVHQSLWTILMAKLNKTKLNRPKPKRTPIKVPDFISECCNDSRNTPKTKVVRVTKVIDTSLNHDMLDQLKCIVFLYFYWITLGVIFVAGTSTVTLFSVGYVIGCFIFLWLGHNLFLKPFALVIQLWDTLIFYNISVIFIKISLQVVGCVYMTQMYRNFCWVLQLFGIACLKTGMDPETILSREILGECNVPHTEAGIFYDGLCFAFLLIQRRIFMSEYFKHIIAEFKSQLFFASRGAELISKITIKDIREAEDAEREVLAKVKRKMDKIRSKHTKTSVVKFADEEGLQGLPKVSFVSDTTEHPSPTSDQQLSPMIPTVIFSDNGNISPISENSAREYQTAQEHFGSLLSPTPVRRPSRLSLKKQSTSAPDEAEDSEDEWYSPSTEKSFDAKIVEGEGGVRGLGPLQLLNFAFKKGAIKEALKESNEIQATHEKLEKEMEETFGVADHQAIRRAIFKQKARRPKADYDEETFNEMAVSPKEELPQLLEQELRRRSGLPAMIVSEKRRLSEIAHKKLRESEDLGLGEGQDAAISDSATKETLDALAFCELLAAERALEDEERFRVIEERRRRKWLKNQKFLAYYHWIKEFLRNLGTFGVLFMRGIVESLISNLMMMSRDYRYVAHILTNEKRLHKQLADDSDDEAMSASFRERKRSMLRLEIENKQEAHALSTSDIDMVRLHEAIQKDGEAPDSKAEEVKDEDDLDEMEIIKNKESADKYLLVRLVKAIYYLLISKSEIICYFMIVLNHMSSASLLSLPLPLMTFLWGTLTVPRPSKRFWITIITYTEIMVLVKTAFQFGFFPWNTSTSVDPLWPPRILGIEKRNKYAAWDLALLMTLFFHRSLLLANGLWNTEHDEEAFRRKIEKKRQRGIEGASRRTSMATIVEVRTAADLRNIAREGKQKLEKTYV